MNIFLVLVQRKPLPMDNKELANRLRSGDVEAFNTIYWHHHQSLFANILKLVKNHSAARDILQDVFMTLWEKREMVNPEQPVMGWLFTVSFNKSVSYLRGHLKRNLSIASVFAANTALAEDSPADDERYIALYDAINKLSPQRRRVFELCKMEGRTYQEAAEEMNISRHTVKEYLSGSMAFVQEYLAMNKKPLAGVLVACLSYIAEHQGK